MRNYKTMGLSNDLATTEFWDVNELIDLFVDLNFEDIRNETLLFQFKIVAHRIGYPKEMVERVVKLGLSEYEKMMAEINATVPKNESSEALKV